MPKGGKLTVKTDISGNMADIRIKDTGCGIPKENREKIFQAFFTTKEDTKGTGLGLFASSQIIKRHGGRINIESEEGKGTIFIIKLPLNS